MKKLILTAFGLTAAASVSVFAQGTIVFNNIETGHRTETHIYAPLVTSLANGWVSQIGNGTADLPAGTSSWTGWSAIGANGLSGQFGGSTTMAELLAAPGLNDPASALWPATAGGITSFHTGAGGGFVVGTTPTFDNIPPDYLGGATVEIVVWDDSSGQYSTWATAFFAWQDGKIAAGESGLENITAQIGGTLTNPPVLPATMQSFNLYYVVPEPAAFALAGLGLATLLVFRRRS